MNQDNLQFSNQFTRDILLEIQTKYEIKIFTEQFVDTIIIDLLMW